MDLQRQFHHVAERTQRSLDLVTRSRCNKPTGRTHESNPFPVNERDILNQLEEHCFLECSVDILVGFCHRDNQQRNYVELNVPLSILERRIELEVRASKCSDVHVSPSNGVVGAHPPTAGLVTAVADLVYNVIGFAKCPVQTWNDQGLFRLLFKCTSGLNSSADDSWSVRTSVCRALSRAADGHRCVRTALADTGDCLHHLVCSLEPITHDCDETYLNAQAQAVLLLATLMSESSASDTICRELKERCSTPFFHLLLQCLESNDNGLQEASLYFLGRFLHALSKKKHADRTEGSFIQYFDNLKSPYFAETTPRVGLHNAGDGDTGDCQPEFLTEELCRELMQLYKKYSIDKNKYQTNPDDSWCRVCSCLCSLFSVSGRARLYAVHRQFPTTLSHTLRGIRDQLSMVGKTAELIRNANNSPVLLSLNWLLTTITCLMVECRNAKETLAEDNIVASLVRLWPWFMMTEQLRNTIVHLLLVFSNGCPAAWSAMCRCVGGRSAVGEVCALARREAALASRTRCPARLAAALRTLAHVAVHAHAIAPILHSDVLSCVYKLRLAERSNFAQKAATAWAQLAEVLARHPDGAASVLELRPVLLSTATRAQLMVAVAHAAHHHRNIFLQAPDLLELLSGTLLTGDTAEMVSAARAVWALAANNHRAKLALRSAGVSAAVTTTQERLQRARRDVAAERALQLLTYTGSVLAAT